MVCSDRSEVVFSDETIRIQNFRFSRKLWWKKCWKLPKLLCYRTEKRIDSKISKISIPNFNSTNSRLEWRLCQYFTSLSSSFLWVSNMWGIVSTYTFGYLDIHFDLNTTELCSFTTCSLSHMDYRNRSLQNYFIITTKFNNYRIHK